MFRRLAASQSKLGLRWQKAIRRLTNGNIPQERVFNRLRRVNDLKNEALKWLISRSERINIYFDKPARFN
ncbi:protein of unknown function [Brevefilum fermentans]|uniref:Transposase n=1 Tax=Candidatus Brevifilum fermentans TaxID=1986204 RepID=A0A1Y6K8S9_9CHLR|nr:protein of unknown function [Brevefilum fermentans]